MTTNEAILALIEKCYTTGVVTVPLDRSSSEHLRARFYAYRRGRRVSGTQFAEDIVFKITKAGFTMAMRVPMVVQASVQKEPI